MNYTSGIFVDHTGDKDRDHEVEVVGYGVENGVKYWHIRNSFGSHWGDNGFFKLIRGIDNLGVENNCSWANAKDTWSEGNEYIHRESEEVRKEHMKDKLYNSIKAQLTAKVSTEFTDGDA